MANLKITLACWDYDRTRALFDGRVRPEGVDVELWSTYNVGEIMERMVRDQQFDLLAGDRAAEVGDGHLDGFRTSRAVDVRIDARQVGDEADLDDVA